VLAVIFMTHLTSIITILTFSLIACSTPAKQDKAQMQDTTTTSAILTSSSIIDSDNWATYKDTVNIGFVVTFKYPKNLYAEHFENAECIGKKIKMVDDGPLTTLDCCMWMDDISEGNIKPIDTLVQYDIHKLKADVTILKDTVDIANVKGTRVRLFDKKDKTKLLRQFVYFTKYDTFFEVNNDRLTTNDFDVFIQSLELDK
jgi:hypothetical protein